MSPTSFPEARSYFFIIGAQRCGTTYLHDLFEESSQVAMAQPVKPEPKWFLDPRKAALGWEAWEKQLFHKTSAHWYGEKGTSYLEYPASASAILKVFPEAKFVVILREPVSRAVSNYRFSMDHGVESLPIDQALTPEAEKRPYDRQKISTSPFSYLKRSCYINDLQPWTNIVPKDRIHIVLFEELVAGEEVFDELCLFLGIEPFKPQGMGHVVNAANEPMPEISPELRKRLKEYFQEPNARLEKFLGRSLAVWDR